MIETIMIFIVVVVSLISAITDWMNGKIYNKVLAACFIPSAAIVLFFYWRNPEQFGLFVANMASAIIIAIMFYGLKVWGAGDSKLWLFANMVFPTTRYIMVEYLLFPSVILLMLIFIEAYVYVLVESVYIKMVKREDGAVNSTFHIKKEWVSNLLFSIAGLTLIYTILSIVIGRYFEANRVFFALIGAMISSRFSSIKFKYKDLISAMMLFVYCVIIFLCKTKVDIWMLLVTFILVFISNISLQFAGKYNYKWIPTENVEEKMILSMITIQMFEGSRVKGLPHSTDETTKCRITENEAEAIKRWGKTKYGREKVLIVRYIPFAIFIFIGIVTYLIGTVIR